MPSFRTDAIVEAIQRILDVPRTDRNSMVTMEIIQPEEAREAYMELCRPHDDEMEPRNFRYALLGYGCKPEVVGGDGQFSFDSLTKTLTVVIPNAIHQVPVVWLNSELHRNWSKIVPGAHFNDFECFGGLTFASFTGPYTYSIKEPDGMIRILGQYWPSVVMEVGWREQLVRLKYDRDLWFRGSQGAVRVVIIVKFSKTATGVKGLLEITTPNLNGEYTVQKRSIWPENEEEDPYIFLRDVYGPYRPENCEFAEDFKLPLRMATLRAEARVHLENLDLVPMARLA
ncbi:hypothetical protein TWF481_008124 [Arthrobotrys musiformis]|uniref:Uncharacterized protein n=1 Tax=Arthrobotrys musiformis TaxID=47236 RepID=A0AAV9W7A1_9PEZI